MIPPVRRTRREGTPAIKATAWEELQPHPKDAKCKNISASTPPRQKDVAREKSHMLKPQPGTSCSRHQKPPFTKPVPPTNEGYINGREKKSLANTSPYVCMLFNLLPRPRLDGASPTRLMSYLIGRMGMLFKDQLIRIVPPPDPPPHTPPRKTPTSTTHPAVNSTHPAKK